MSRLTNIQLRFAVASLVCGATAFASSLAGRSVEQAPNPRPLAHAAAPALVDIAVSVRPAPHSDERRPTAASPAARAPTAQPLPTAVMATLDDFEAPTDNDHAPHPSELEALWANEASDDESSQTLRDIISAFESAKLDASAIQRIDCRETLCRLEIDVAPSGVAAYLGLGLLLKAPLASFADTASPGRMVAFVAQDAIANAQQAVDAPALPFAYWE